MPFAANIYYPPQLPAPRHYWTGMPGSTFPVNFPSSSHLLGSMLAGPSMFPAFKFQLRRDTIDWRRFSAIDVERVARELDLATLQENINSITFCNLDAEKCPYCQQPVDPVLLKVFKMAQLTIEYLLHSQEYLSMSLALQEEQHQATLEDLKRVKQDWDKQAEELKGVKEESRRRKKMIATQQLLLQAGANNYHKCQLCDKTFMNYSFLQAHMLRRHPEATAAEQEKKKQVVQMESEIEELKVKLKETHAQLEAESQSRAQEAEHLRQREEESIRKFERWKEEERVKFQREMEDLRHLFLTEFKDIASKNSALEGKLQELQGKSAVVSNLGTLQDDESSDQQQWKKTQRELQGMKAKIEQQIKLLSSSKPKEITVPKAETTEESTEEELEDTLDRKKRVLEALRRNPNLLKQFRPILEETLDEKLESMGVKRGSKGIPAQTYKHLRDVIKTQQQQKAKKFPQLLALRNKIEQEVKRKVKRGQKDESDLSLPLSGTSGKSQRSPQSPIQVVSSKPRMQQVEFKPYASEMPKAAPRSKVSSKASSVETPRMPSPKQVRSSTPSLQYSAAHHPSTSPFSSEEESEEESNYTSPKFAPRKTEPDPPRATQNEESDWDSSDIDLSEGKGSMGRVLATAAETRSETVVQSMAKNLERTLSASGKKPAGGVKLFPINTKEAPKPAPTTKKIQFVDEDSDLEISSLEEVTPHLETNSKKPPATRSSGDSAESRGTSLWGSGSTRAGAW
nr:zinc finger protein DZIP1L [Zootoca vivipara]